jgi:hypothetical protein
MSVQLLGVVLALAIVVTVLFIPAPDKDSFAGGARKWRWGGVVAGAVAGLIIALSMGLGRGLLLAAPVFSLGVLLGVVLGELRTPRPLGPVRRAAVETRSVLDYLPKWPAALVGVAGIFELVLLTWTTSLGSADDLGRAGRSLTRVCGDMTMSRSPWLGFFYSLPLGAAVVLGLLLTVIGLRRTAGRPRPVGQAGELVQDDAVRRRSATALTGACGVLITVPLLGASFVTAAQLVLTPCRADSWKPIGCVLLVLMLGWFALFVWSVRAIVAPSGQPQAIRVAV